MHRKIRRFGIEGIISDDSKFTTTRIQHEKLVIDDMRDRGYVPVLGMGPYFAPSYNENNNNYDFTVTAYGVFVGERKAWRIEGIDVETGTLFPRSTRPNKSKQSSTPAE